MALEFLGLAPEIPSPRCVSVSNHISVYNIVKLSSWLDVHIYHKYFNCLESFIADLLVSDDGISI